GRVVFLIGAVGETPLKAGDAVRTRNFRRTVRAARVHHHNFVGDSRKRSQRARQVVFLIERNQAGGKAVHRTPGNCGIGASISQSQTWESKHGWTRLAEERSPATSAGNSRESCCRRCETRYHPATWRRARVLRRRTCRWSNPCP